VKNPLYRLLSLGLSLVSGVLAGAMFKGMWKLIAREDDAPQATDPQRSWKEILRRGSSRRGLCSSQGRRRAWHRAGQLQAGPVQSGR
jgi:Protein of unknown function (DUF4235)